MNFALFPTFTSPIVTQNTSSWWQRSWNSKRRLDTTPSKSFRGKKGQHLLSFHSTPRLMFAQLWLRVKPLPQIYCEAPFRSAEWAHTLRRSCGFHAGAWRWCVCRAKGEIPHPRLLLCAAFKQTVIFRLCKFRIQLHAVQINHDGPVFYIASIFL